MKIFKSPQFVRLFKKYVRKVTRNQLKEVEVNLKMFEKNWKDPRLKTHKLTQVKGKWAFTVLRDKTRNDRIIFIFKIQKLKRTTEKAIWLLGVGTHDEVYGKQIKR